MVVSVNLIIVTYLAGYIFEIGDRYIRLPKRAVHFLKGLRSEVSGNTLGFNVVPQVLDQVHFGEITLPPFVILIIRAY